MFCRCDSPANENYDFIDKFSHFRKRRVSNIETELEEYFKEDTSLKTDDPLLYWKAKKSTAPCLSEMARNYLAAPSTSTPAELAFSQGRLLIHYTRSRLTVEHMRALMCLKSWQKKNLCWILNTELLFLISIFIVKLSQFIRNAANFIGKFGHSNTFKSYVQNVRKKYYRT